MSEEDKESCITVVMQGIASALSAISTMLVVNVFGGDDAKARAYAIIVFASGPFIIHIFKFIKEGLPAGNGTIMFAKRASGLAIGFSDSMFDIFAAVAILQPGVIIDMDSTAIVFGTFLGLSEELVEFLFDLCLKVAKCGGDVPLFHVFLIQTMMAMAQPAAMAVAIEKSMGAAVETDPPPAVWVFCFIAFVILLGTVVLLKLDHEGETYTFHKCVQKCTAKNAAK